MKQSDRNAEFLKRFDQRKIKSKNLDQYGLDSNMYKRCFDDIENNTRYLYTLEYDETHHWWVAEIFVIHPYILEGVQLGRETNIASYIKEVDTTPRKALISAIKTFETRVKRINYGALNCF